MNARKVLFIDRDGTLIQEPEDEQIDSFEKLVFYPKVISSLRKISIEFDYMFVMITNQDGLGTKSFPENTFFPVQTFIVQTFKNEGIFFHNILIDRTFAKDNTPTRKPKTGLLTDYFSENYDLKNSFVIGDRLTDVELAKNLGAKAIYLNNETHLGEEEVTVKVRDLKPFISLETNDWEMIYHFLKLRYRKVNIQRKTKETEVHITLNLDGEGKAVINTGIGFFDHMLEQLARHGQMDLEISVKGDLHVDEHHTIEDTAIALGEVFAKALSNKIGIERYGFCLPMDDCLAQVAIDFSGRSGLVWEAKFKREKIGEMPTEMFYHFFKSFIDSAKANANIKAEGTNEHHKIEAIFKAFARAVKAAIKRDPEKMILPSTKGML